MGNVVGRAINHSPMCVKRFSGKLFFFFFFFFKKFLYVPEEREREREKKIGLVEESVLKSPVVFVCAVPAFCRGSSKQFEPGPEYGRV